MNIPIQTALRLNPDFQNPIKHSHVYSRAIDATTQFISFIVPNDPNITWTDLRITSTGTNDFESVLRLNIECDCDCYHSITRPISVNKGVWTPFPWPIQCSILTYPVTLRINTGTDQPQHLMVKLLGFDHLFNT